jgi:hypothetical protein
MAPAVGFEPTTNRLTADRSTTELRWISFFWPNGGHTVCPENHQRQVVSKSARLIWLRGRDLNPRPSGYEPDELPGCSTPRFENSFDLDAVQIEKVFARWKRGETAILFAFTAARDLVDAWPKDLPARSKPEKFS